MAGQADGRILIDSAIDPQGFEAGSKRLQSAVRSLSTKVESLGGTFQKALSGNPRAMEAFQAKAAQLQQTVERLGADLARLGAKKAPSDAYKDLSAETEKAGVALQKLLDKQDKLDNRGTSKTSQAYKNLQADIAAASARYDELAAKKAQMEASGTAWVSGTETEEYQSMSAAIDAANARLGAMRERIEEAASASHGLLSAFQGLPSPLSIARSAFNGILGVVKSIGSAISRLAKGVANLAKTVAKKLLSAFKSVLSTARKLFVGNKSISGSVGSLTSSLKKLIPAMLAARGVMGILRKGVNAFLDANEQVKSQLEATWNGLGNVLGPIITRIVNLVSTAISYVVAFLRLLGFGVSGGSGGGGTSNISAVGKAYAGVGGAAKIATIQTDAFGKKSAAAISSVGGAAASAADEIHAVGDAAESTAKKIQNLSGLDEIHTWRSEQDAAGAGGGGGGGVDIGDVSATLPEVTLPDWAKLMAEQLRSGAWEEAAKTLSDKLNDMVDSVNWPSLGDRLGDKVAGVLKFLATFIREFDFADMFSGLFTALRQAIEKLDAEDIGALLAARFVIIFSALQGALESGVIPEAIKKLGGAIEGFFKTIREKFNDETDPAHGGWYVVGQNLGNVIGQIINAVADLLSSTNWNQIIGDIGEFWSGLWDALRSGSNAPDWGKLFDAIKTACKRLLVRMLQWLPQSDESRQTWKTLESRLEKGGDKVSWGEIFSALWDTLMDLVDELIEHIPSRAELVGYWDEMKDRLAQALDYANWDEMTDAFAETLKKVIAPAIDSFLDYLYEQLRESHPYIAAWLFPNRAAIETASKQFQSDLEKYTPEIAAKNLKLWVDTKSITEEQAREIAADAGFAYSEGLLTSLPAVEDSAREVVSAATVSIEDATAMSQQIMDTSGRAAVIAYLNGLIAEGALTGSEASKIVDSLTESMVSRTEMYSFELEEGGAAAARAYLDGLIAEGAVSYEEAAQIATNAADGLTAQSSQFAEAAQVLANEYIGKLQGKVPEASAAGRALGDASAGAAKGVSESSTDIGSAAESAAAAVPVAIEGQQQPAYDAGVDVGEKATSGVESGLKGFEETVTDAMDGAAKGGAKSAQKMRTDVNKHTRLLHNDVSDTFEGMSEDMTDSFSRSNTKVNVDAKSMAATVKTQLNSMKTTMTSVLSSIKSTATSNMTGIKQALNLDGVSSSISAEMKAAASAVSSQWTSIRNTLSSTTAGIRADIANAWSGIPGVISSQLSGVPSAVAAPFVSVRNSAYSWGSEFSSQLASGIRSGVSRIASAAANAAATVRSYLHFSVPDKGPLADADEYGPDFIRLLADGMLKNKGLAARAASSVATDISAGLQKGEYSLPEIKVSKVDAAMDSFGDRITAGFSSMIDRLQAIADSITFKIPSVATAGVMPYSVAGGGARARGQDAELMAAINSLARKIESMSSRPATYTFTGKIDRRVLFKEVLNEARAVQVSIGKNPFDL